MFQMLLAAPTVISPLNSMRSNDQIKGKEIEKSKKLSPRIYLVTFYRGMTPKVEAIGLIYQTVYNVVKTSSTSISYNCKMLHTH